MISISLKSKRRNRIELIILLSSIWFTVTLPLPWIIGNSAISDERIFAILPIIGVITVPFVILLVAWTLKPELTT